MSIDELAQALIEQRLQQEKAALQERYKDVHLYKPSDSYPVGQTVMFPALDFATAQVIDQRAGVNPEYGDFNVIRVQFDDQTTREFAADLTTPHVLSESEGEDNLPGLQGLDADQILRESRSLIVEKLTDKLRETGDLVSVAGKWFSRGLMPEVNEGYLNLAEAVLDLAEGGPLRTEDILEQIGGLGDMSEELQLFCMNHALNQDERFDEVGPLNHVLWYLKRVEPPEVQNTPEILRYHSIDYDPDILSPEQVALEAEIDDEWSPAQKDHDIADQVVLSLIFPHRRAGTLPLNAAMRNIFPTARRTPRIAVTLVDCQDGQEYPGWVVRQERYVFGMGTMYQKHRLPVGTLLVARRQPDSDKIVVDFHAHRPRTEWVRLVTNKNGQIAFDDQKRGIGAEYDDLMILGTDDLAEVDKLTANYRRSTISSILRTLIAELSHNSPQGTVHAKTLYSAFNVLRRCPPGPIFAALDADPDFEHVGNHYWRLSSS
ncbi:MAG: hypothetical protein IT319_02865 [Anaerolineae bacterium]|nr:hypothetical protein [Anaerolineae bacterium]